MNTNKGNFFTGNKVKETDLIDKVEIFRGFENLSNVPSNISGDCEKDETPESQGFHSSLSGKSRERLDHLIDSYKRRLKEQHSNPMSPAATDREFNWDSFESRKNDWRVMTKTIFQTDMEKSLVSNTLRIKPDNILFQNISHFSGSSSSVWDKAKSTSMITKKSANGPETLEERMIKVDAEEQSISDGKLEVLAFDENIKGSILGKIFRKKAHRISQSKSLTQK